VNSDDKTILKQDTDQPIEQHGNPVELPKIPADPTDHPPTFANNTEQNTPSKVDQNPSDQATLAHTESTNSSSFTNSASLAVGDILKERFKILEVVGKGGMGTVYKVLDFRKVEAKAKSPYTAIKVLNPAFAKDDLFMTGLQRECEKAQKLSHPNIIRVFDFDRDHDYVFMSMEYLAGQTLSQIIQETNAARGLTLDKAWPIIESMGKALAYAHSNGIVHSDFKPGNVFITETGEVKVLDFGIASRIEKNEADETVFNAREHGGLTPGYASFEMWNGSKADPRDDVYSFGLVVYELLTGKHPYDRKEALKVYSNQLKGTKIEPLPVKGLSHKQWQLLKSAIEILQEDRPADLNQWLTEFNRPEKPNWLVLGVAGLAIVIIGIGTIILQKQPSDQPNAEQKQSISPTAPPEPKTESPAPAPEPAPVPNATQSQLPATQIDTKPVAPEPLTRHEASSKDGVIQLAASKPEYHVGEKLKLNLHVTKSGYLRVIFVGNNGEISTIVPNKFQSGKVSSGASFNIPPKAKTFDLNITGPIGIDKIVAIYSESAATLSIEKAVNADGSLVQKLKSLEDSTASIQYEVKKK